MVSGHTSATMSDMIGVISTGAVCLGYNLKHEQWSALNTLVGSRDVFVSLPTGCGKSLCYGLLPTVFYTLGHRGKKLIVKLARCLIGWCQ